jgi:nitrite reductase/ring-hydroxylating ferredoxin subunit
MEDKQMKKGKIILALTALVAISLLVLPACSSQPASANNNSGTARQILIKGQINGDSVSIPVSDVDKNTNTRFQVSTATDTLTFMVYKYDNQYYVRADICPPCGSESFTSKQGTLVCDSCGTVFDAKTGAGIRGACIRYPKQSAPYSVQGGNIVVNANDLLTAYQNTIRPK